MCSRFRFWVFGLALAVVTLCSQTGCTRSEERPVLHLYTSLAAEESQVYIREFEKESGVEVKWVRLSAGETLARLEAEKNNPQVSVWHGSPSPEHIVAANRGLLEPYEPQLDYELKPPFRDPKWYWTGFYFGAIGFACNQKFLAEKKTTCPTTWAELLKPEFKGQISMAYPYTSGTSYTVVAALLGHFGQKKGWDYLRKLDKQVHHYNSSGSAAVTQVGLGEVGVGVSFSHDILKKGTSRGYPIELSIPKDGTGTEIGAIALVKGGKESELGKRFIDWVHSKNAQSLLKEFYRVPLHPQARIAEGAITAKDVKLIDFDPHQAAESQKEILSQWRKVTGR